MTADHPFDVTMTLQHDGCEVCGKPEAGHATKHVYGDDGSPFAKPSVVPVRAVPGEVVDELKRLTTKELEQLTAERAQARAEVERLRGGQHTYLIAPGSESGTWGAYCEACSVAEGDYVRPCRERKRESPPPVLVDVAQRDQARRIAVELEQELARLTRDGAVVISTGLVVQLRTVLEDCRSDPAHRPTYSPRVLSRDLLAALTEAEQRKRGEPG